MKRKWNNSLLPWILVAVLLIGGALWYIFAGKAPRPDHSAYEKQIQELRDSLHAANKISEQIQAQSQLREDSLQQIINRNQTTLDHAMAEKNKIIDYYRSALIRHDVPTLQRFFSEYYGGDNPEK